MSEPIEGLAHFCEHMLFLGSEKFPSDNDYKDFVTKNGGYCNAHTSTDYTNYHFKTKNDAAYETLERF